MKYEYKSERMRLEVDAQRSTDKFTYFSWWVCVANESVGMWDIHSIAELGTDGWELVSIDTDASVGMRLGTFKRILN